jgi:hypothetical protein
MRFPKRLRANAPTPLLAPDRRACTSAWGQVFRALEHGFAKNACLQARNLGLPAAIIAFADAFTALQEQRHQADYDPSATAPT